ncbi:uncharacterized protein LOC128222258 [Mya arenaria]|uniref:uncharacterized protein LOC128222258 n=1 Tax=Mya arenaria TaxID=6604 RepID=UPI0022E74C85|nr:uncharacterized protein LOC128222258 [Mya arenaria]XP_052787175.1 uncharacterized protein LOC128222258 [Mya arenaria]
MRLIPLCLMFGVIALRPVAATRLSKLEEDVKVLNNFIIKELRHVRDEVEAISYRVEILEKSTVKHNQRSSNQDMEITSHYIRDKTKESGEQFEDDRNNDASHVVLAIAGNIREAYSNDKKDLHILKHDVKGQLGELEQQITNHIENLTTNVQQSIEDVHVHISLANITLLEFINRSASNVSIFADFIKQEMAEFIINAGEQIDLRLNETEAKLNESISSTFRQNEEKLQRFIAITDYNVSETMLEAESIVNLIRTNFSEMSTQVTNVSLELQTIRKEVQDADERLWNSFELTSSDLGKEIASLKICLRSNIKITNDDYYYPCAKDIRLANAHQYRNGEIVGRLEVRHNDEWGALCHDTYDMYLHSGEPYITKNVNVVCRTFGFRECDYIVTSYGWHMGSKKKWMDNVKCLGTESSILECPHDGWEVKKCGRYYGYGKEVMYRLKG